MEKSKLYGIGIEPNVMEEMALVIGCKSEKLPSTFLAMPIGSNMRLKRPWKPLIEKFKKKLSSWKIKTLSFGGTHTIASNVLGSLGNFLFSLYRVPRGVLREIEGLRRNFFWGSDQEKIRIPWVKWEEVIADKAKGGLGIGSMDDLNKALLAKWYRRYKNEKEALWVKIVDSIHGKLNHFDEKDKIKSGFVWKQIVKLWDSLKEDGLDPRMLVKRRVGHGKSSKFWTDWWTGETSLNLKFPRAFNSDPYKRDTVHEMINKDGIKWAWRDSVRDGRTKEEIDNLHAQISSMVLNDKDDSWYCPDGPKDQFTVAWMRKKLIKKNQPATGKNRWSKWVNKKTNIFFWRACKDKLAVKESLAAKQIATVNTTCEV